MKKVKELARRTYQSTKTTLPKSVFWSVPALLAVLTLMFSLHLITDNTVKPTTARDAGRATVAIVRSDLKSGGTGVVLKSSSKQSTVLTNGHVCRVVENGGIVVGDDGRQHAVTGYKRSQAHDLCLVTVAADLEVETKLASSAPDYYSSATVAGHPALLPTVVTSGHFSGHLIINVLTEITPCTEEDLKSSNAIMCIFFGGIPKVSTYESQLVTATIQPGSSGSAVYNSKGEISALVFAGSGDLGYAIVVPYEFVAYFLEQEQHTLEYTKPQTTRAIVATSADGSKNNNSKNKYRPKSGQEIVRDCMTKPEAKENPDISKICQIFNRDMIFHDEQ